MRLTEIHHACLGVRDLDRSLWTEPIAVDVPDYGRIDSVVCEDPDGILVELLTLPAADDVRALRAAKRAA